MNLLRKSNRSGRSSYIMHASRITHASRIRAFPLVLIIAVLLAGGALGERALAATLPAPEVSDVPDDWGSSLRITWEPPLEVARYELWRLETEKGPASATLPLPYAALAAADTAALADFLRSRSWVKAGEPDFEDTLFADTELSRHKQYEYQLIAFGTEGAAAFGVTAPRSPVRQWIKFSTLNILVAVAAFLASVLILVARARRGAKLFIRRIAGLEAVEEAVGRATEMGKKIFYIPGILSLSEIQTIASLSILKHVSKLTAIYGTDIEVPNKDPLVFSAARETVRQSYMEAGKPDQFKEEMVTYLTYDQFAYAASVTAKMVREKPATNFMIGSFFAESLILAETGQAAGAIQIAGTADVTQLPFFVTTCDYTLLGEELYAASAYLSREPVLLGSIKAQDAAKAILMVIMALGIVMLAFRSDIVVRLLETH